MGGSQPRANAGPSSEILRLNIGGSAIGLGKVGDNPSWVIGSVGFPDDMSVRGLVEFPSENDGTPDVEGRGHVSAPMFGRVEEPCRAATKTLVSCG